MNTGQDTHSTDDSSKSGARSNAGVPALVVVLAGQATNVGSVVVPLGRAREILIGRSATAGVTATESGGVLRVGVPDAKVSGEHLRLARQVGGATAFDLGSRNGTSVQGAPLEGTTELAFGTPFLVGTTLLTLSAGAAVGHTWPVPTASASWAEQLSRLERIATTTLPVLIEGETGVGKEVVALAVHERSGRPGPFVAVNCSALPKALLESQMFGHVRGAFSGAVADAQGFFRAAHQGTLFLDEVGDFDLDSQPALLRALQQGEICRVGATKADRVDVRVVSATHKPIEDMVARGSFRQDLFARLRGYSTMLPPLRSRREDLGHLLKKIGEVNGLDLRFSADAVTHLYNSPFPMNVRELAQAVVTGYHLANGHKIRARHLPTPNEPLQTPATPRRRSSPPPDDGALRKELEERLVASGGNLSQVARDMGKARQQIQRWVRRFGL